MNNKFKDFIKYLLIINLSFSGTLYAQDSDYTPGELRLLGITNTQHTYNPSKQIGEAIKEKGKDNSAYEKTKSFLQKIKEIKDNTNDTLHDITYKMDLPVKADTKSTQVFEGSVSWSLVNEKCEIDPKAVFQKALKNLVEKYKKIWQQLQNGDLWKMWAINKSIELITKMKAIPTCMEKLFSPTGNPNYVMDIKTYTSLYNQCMAKNLKDSVKLEQGNMAGTTNATKFGFKTDIKSMAFQAYYAYICKDEAMYKVFGQRYEQCIEDERSKMLGWINGKIDLGIKLDLAQFKIEQQSCILKKYNMELDMQDIIMDAFDLNAEDTEKGSKLTITNKNAAVNNPSIQTGISKVIAKAQLDIIGDKKMQKIIKDMIRREMLLRTKNSNIEDETLTKAFGIYYYMYINWVFDVFNMSNNPVTFIFTDNDGHKIIDGKAFLDRWQMPFYFGYTRRGLFEDPKYASKAREVFKTDKIISVAEECRAIVDDTNAGQEPEVFLFSNYAAEKDPIIKNDDISFLKTVTGISQLNPGAKNYKNRFQYYFNILQYNEGDAYPELSAIVNASDSKKLDNLKTMYMNIYTTRNMLNTCISWASSQLAEIEKIEPMARRRFALAASIANGKMVQKKQRQIAKDLMEQLDKYLSDLKSYIRHIITVGNQRINELNEYQKQYEKKFENINKNKNPTILYENGL